jgi:hypothetical protein
VFPTRVTTLITWRCSATTGNRAVTVSQMLRREPRTRLSAQALFAGSSRTRSRRSGPRRRGPSPRAFWLPLSAKGQPTVQMFFAESSRAGALGENPVDSATPTTVTVVPVCQIRRESGLHGSRRIGTHDTGTTFAESTPSSVSVLALLTTKFSKKT